RLEAHGHDRLPELRRRRGPREHETTGPVDLAIRAGVQEGFVSDHDYAERAAHPRVRFGARLPNARGPQPRSEALRVQPRVEELFGRGGDLPAHGDGVPLVLHDELDRLPRSVTNASSEASCSLQNRW